MEKKKYELLMQLLTRLQEAGVLKNVLVIGSWCMLLYERYFDTDEFRAALRTRDVDLLIPIPFRQKEKIDISPILDDLGFVTIFKGKDGYQTFHHPDLILEFLVPERGRGHEGPFDVPMLGINAQPIRYLDMLSDSVIEIDYEDLLINVPHPANFALHKLIVSERRKNSVKSDNDHRQGVQVLRALIDHHELRTIKEVAERIPKTWQKLIQKDLSATVDEDLISQIW